MPFIDIAEQKINTPSSLVAYVKSVVENSSIYRLALRPKVLDRIRPKVCQWDSIYSSN